MAVCRELTKVHEEVFRGTAAEALLHFEAPRGEFVLLLEGSGAPGSLGNSQEASEDEIRAHLQELRDGGVRGRDASDSTAATFGISRNRAYRLWLETQDSDTAGQG